MGLLNSDIKTKSAKSKKLSPGSVSDTLFVPTGFDILDYYSGTVVKTDEGEEFMNVGLPMGKIIMYVGHSQSGKTTKAIQDAWHMVKDLNGDVIICDFERSSNDLEGRVMNITGCSEEEFAETFTLFKQRDLTAEFLKKFLFEIAAKKEELGKACYVDWYDIRGNEMKIYPPTVVIIDSVASMRSKELMENADMDTNMTAAAIAKSNSSFLTSIDHLLEEYNITLLAINHITTKITINPYAAKKIQLPGLADDENLPGGNKFIFLASYIFRFTSGKSLKADKDLMIEGREVRTEILKSRSGFNVKNIPIVYTARQGFNNILTNYVYAKENGIFKSGGKSGFSLTTLPDIKFTQKDFALTYNDNEDFREEFDRLVTDKYAAILKTKNSTIFEKVSSTDEIEEEFDE